MTGLGNIDDVYKHYLVVIEENQQLKDDCRVLKTALNCHEDIRKGLYDKCERMENLLVECKFILEGVLNYPTSGLVSKISKELKK
jgi:hypothetical protein